MALAGQGLLRNLTFADDLGDRVDVEKMNPFKSPDLDLAADYHVAFVWGIVGQHSNGITHRNFTLLKGVLKDTKREVTAAHEFLHFLCGSGIVRLHDHDTHQSDLLFTQAPHGINMRKSRLDKVIR